MEALREIRYGTSKSRTVKSNEQNRHMPAPRVADQDFQKNKLTESSHV